MGLFGKKEKKSEVEIPTLPKLPKLPDFPEMSDEGIRQLPSFPSSQIGKKFSQDTIKDAVSGERGDKSFYEEDLPEEEIFQGNMRRPSTEEIEYGGSDMPVKRGVEREIIRQEIEPVFVRIDRFEDGLKTFENIKTQIADIERMLADTKRLKEKEEAELHSWEEELKKMKSEIEKIGMDIFSKV